MKMRNFWKGQTCIMEKKVLEKERFERNYYFFGRNIKNFESQS